MNRFKNGYYIWGEPQPWLSDDDLERMTYPEIIQWRIDKQKWDHTQELTQKKRKKTLARKRKAAKYKEPTYMVPMCLVGAAIGAAIIWVFGTIVLCFC